MKSKKMLFGFTSLLAVAALSGCRPTLISSSSEASSPSEDVTSNSGDSTSGATSQSSSSQTVAKTKIDFWTGFGTAVNGVLEPLIARFEEQNPDIDVVYETKGGYPALQQAISGSISTSTYPHIANGYPDHFAGYVNANILVKLNSATYINNPTYGVDVNDYYADFMTENTELVRGNTLGLPFNKSTEIMVINQSFFDVAKIIDPSIYIPETWQDIAIVGPKLKAVAALWIGKLVNKDGTTIDKDDADTPEKKALVSFDMTNLTSVDQFIPFSYDSAANFFITILRQWGAEYTAKGSTVATGTIKFASGDSRTKALAALAFFKQLHKDKLIGLPSTYGEGLYSSKPFKEGRLVMTISSSAGVKENLPNDITDYPFEIGVRAIPYNGDLPNSKYVISQGTNLALFTKGKGTDPQAQKERLAAWRLLRYLTYEVNFEFGKGTSYFPVTDGTKIPVDENNQRYKDYKLYSEFLNATGGTSGEIATRATANLQVDVYQNTSIGWNKFVDPGFLGSSTIRDEVSYVMGLLFDDATSTTNEAAALKALDAVIKKLNSYVA